MVLTESTPPIPEETLRSYIETADSGVQVDAEVRERILAAFEAYECWLPLFRLIRRSVDAGAAGIEDYLRLGRVQSQYLDDVFAAAETCVQAVRRLKLTFVEFQDRLLSNIVESEDWKVEATVLQAVVREFSEKKDIVAAYERLCLLFEKKIHNEDALNKSYQELLQLEPNNLKALRYFKLMLTQSADWREVASILTKMIEASHRPQDIFRLGQELAAVLLYQLDQPQESIKAIEMYCADSPLDTSTIHYDAYQRIGDWRGCLGVLQACLRRVEEDGALAVLHYKAGVLHDQLAERADALAHYQLSMQHWPSFLEPYERAITAEVNSRNWPRVRELLAAMAPQIVDDRLRPKISEAIQRIDESLSDGQIKDR